MTAPGSIHMVLAATLLLTAAVVVCWPRRGGPIRFGGAAEVGRSPGGSTGDDAATVGLSATDARGSAAVAGRPVGRRGAHALAAAEDRLADLLGLVAAPLRVGVPAVTSLAAGAVAVEGDPVLGPLLDDLVAAGAAGEPVSTTWLLHAQRLDSAALRFVGQAWLLSEQTGAPLADALRSSEEVLRARTRARQRLASAAAGPRASMGVLGLLPLSGPVVGLACGIGPRQLYFSTTWSTVSLVVGIGFAAFGWWWSRSILERAA